MRVSIAICSWNRSQLLRQTLEQLTRLVIPQSIAWEVIVVDNASTDDTRAVIESFGERLPIKYVFEKQAGHSRSRNTAISQVSGDLILWTDNDVRVNADWLEAYVRAAQTNPLVAYFGGKIIPVFESTKPKWLAETWTKCEAVYAGRDLGDREFIFAPDQFPFGANFAIRTEIQKRFLYDADWGRRAGSMLGDDEIDCLRRVNAAGHVGMWIPTAQLEHVIPDNRATPDYVGKYYVGQGQANVRKRKPTMGSAFTAFRVATFNRFLYRLKKYRTVPDEWVSHLIRGSIAWGEYLGLRGR